MEKVTQEYSHSHCSLCQNQWGSPVGKESPYGYCSPYTYKCSLDQQKLLLYKKLSICRDEGGRNHKEENGLHGFNWSHKQLLTRIYDQCFSHLGYQLVKPTLFSMCVRHWEKMGVLAWTWRHQWQWKSTCFNQNAFCRVKCNTVFHKFCNGSARTPKCGSNLYGGGEQIRGLQAITCMPKGNIHN